MNPSTSPAAPELEAWEKLVRDHVRRLRFGVVQITIHEGSVTQVDATERTRFPAAPAARSSTKPV